MEASRRTPQPGKRGTPWSLILFAAVALYALLLVILNDERVSVHFVLFEARISKLVLILLCLGLGFAAGFLFDHWRDRRQARESG
jgi:ABC-type polysaccharide/polyol phosphate export permease